MSLRARSAQWFDPDRHGWDGELCELPPRGDAGDADVRDDGLEPPYQVQLHLEYPSHLLGDPASSDLQDRAPELFSWFTLLGRAAPGGPLGLLLDAECA
ncbi:MAG: hypothetical protein ABMB14_40335 [Myxococcota bacterium]